MSRRLWLLALLLAAAKPAQAHPGRTDRKGCHKERSTGKRHCH